MKHEFEVLLDMDGVASNFSKKVADIMGLTLTEGQEVSAHPNFQKGKMWHAIHSYDAKHPFFYDLEKMPDFDELFDFVIEYFDHDTIGFLTASGHTPVDAPQQKRRWIRRYVGDYNTIVVPKSLDKAQYAKPNIILIDDRAKSIDPWVEAGGIGILHTNAKDTIAQLKVILGI